MRLFLSLMCTPALVLADDICPICLKIMRMSTINQELCCGHVYHATCIGTALQTDKPCPLCREEIVLHTDRHRVREHDCCESRSQQRSALLERYRRALHLIQNSPWRLIPMLYLSYLQLRSTHPANSDEILAIQDEIERAIRQRFN